MVASLLNPLGVFIDNRLNPILVRELRRMVRSRFIVVMINLYILLLVFTCLMNITLSVKTITSASGQELFGILSWIMGFSSFVVVVIYTGIAGAGERINGDLMYSSAIKPTQIILGKFISGLVLSLLLFSAVFPFFTLAYLLRGLDLYTFLTTVYSIFLAIHTINAVVIFISCNVRSVVQMVFLGFAALFFMYVGFASFAVYRFSYGMGPWGGAYWQTLLIGTLFSLSVIIFFLLGAIAAISPPSSNRMVPLRIFTSLWVIAFSVFFVWIQHSPIWGGFALSSQEFLVYHTAVLMVLLVLITAERDHWNLRIRRTIPKFPPFRMILFPFYTGAACAVVWWLVYFGAFGLFCFTEPSLLGKNETAGAFYLVLMSFDFFATALLIRTVVFPKIFAPNKTWVIALLLCVCTSLATMLIYFFINYSVNSYDPLEGYNQHFLSILNPFSMIFELGNGYYGLPLQCVGTLVWSAILAPILLVWVLIRFARFSPVMPEDILTYERAMEILNIPEQDREKKQQTPES